ncbi:MAG: M15 family metallopeptidase [Ilumatobacter sp.]|uniref:M15 family metallopeptidase n=1 Tax=Ilumatobacter sp. TaxID=1967498 RepID=UPI002612E1DA|nr:M15 family metallopeptidase [Ilumatobacter sp.]MDJ0767446.1 M15 family metallopeptidase [Ilumatobacter sp.]
MSSISSLSSIRARIDSIESRFTPERVDQQVALDTAEFDPFGEHYERAVAATRPAAPRVQQHAEGTAPVAFRETSMLPLRESVATSSATGSLQASGGLSIDTILAAVAGRAGVAGPRQIGGYGPMPVPEDLAAFGNGRIPKDALSPLAAQPNHRLTAPAAAAWDAVVRAAAADGFELTITDSYRSYPQQVDLAERKGLYAEGGLAARPGTSNHGWGLAVDADVRDPALLEWLKTNGPRFGWVEAVPREPWHWEFRPAQV